jgi:Tfp pilus assembly protein PilX
MIMSRKYVDTASSERGAALVSTLLIMALLVVMALGISLTSVSELGVSSAYTSQTRAFEAAEAGLNHAASLVANFQPSTSDTAPAPMTQLLALRGATFPANLFPNGVFDPKWLATFAAANPTDARGTYFYNTFADNGHFADNPGGFTTGSVAIPATGLALNDANGNATGATYRVAVIDDEALNDNATPPNPSVPNFNPPAVVSLAGWHEDGDPTVDQDKRIVAYSTGTYANTSVTLEGWVGFVPYPALLSNGDIAAGGNSSIDGTYGSVHSNSNLTVSGSAYIAQSATASGTYTGPASGSGSGGGSGVGGFSGGGQPPIYMPKFVTEDPDPQIQNYLLKYTDILLVDAGFATGADVNNPPTATDAATLRLQNLATSVGVDYGALRNELIDPTQNQAVTINRSTSPATVKNMQNLTINGNPGQISDTGWSNSSGNWSLNNPPAANIIPSSTASQVTPANNNAYTFYVVGVDNASSGTANGGNVKVTGNVGSSVTGGVEITVFATGSITIGGTPNMQAHLKASTPELPPYDKPSILFVMIEDLKCNGDLDIASRFNGIIYLGEQFNLSGNGKFNGQVLGKNNTDMSGSPVSSNQIWGHFDLTLNTGGMIGTVKIISWRQIKE